MWIEGGVTTDEDGILLSPSSPRGPPKAFKKHNVLIFEDSCF